MTALPGTNTLLVGATGTGKTHSLGTLCAAGIETFVLFTEPGMEVVSALGCEFRPGGTAPLHYAYLPAADPEWSAMIDSASKINRLSFKSLTELRDINKSAYGQFISVLGLMSNFRCDCCGQEFGAVDSWGTSRAICVDSLSGLNVMAMDLVAGSKPVKAIADWGVAMDNLERLVNKLCASTKCFFVLTAHLEREHDEVVGSTQLMASTLGRKLAPRLPRFFSDVVQTVRSGDKFLWDTAAVNVDLKARNLALQSGLRPDFAQIIEAWEAKGGTISWGSTG